MAGLAETLLTLVEDLAGQLGELCPQVVTRCLQVCQPLLMGVVLFAQFGFECGMGRAQPTQFTLLGVALGLQIGNGFIMAVTLRAQQFGLAAQRSQLGLLR